MKIYHCESNYITIPDATRLVLTKLGFDENDEKNYKKIYRIIRRLEEEGILKTEKLNERMNKIKRSEMKNLVQIISKHFGSKKQIKKKSTSKKDNSKETTSISTNFSTTTKITEKDITYSINNNLEFIKGLLEGKYDNLLDIDEKMKLLRDLINEEHSSE